MGCDIHMFVEYKINNGKWQAHPGHKVEIEDEGTDNEYKTYKEVSATGRNYELFGALAGVRYDGPDAKGAPEDCSELVAAAIESWDCDGHSHSYLSLDEFQGVLNSFDYFEPTDRIDMFYNWNTVDRQNMPPEFTTIVSGCSRHAMELLVDDILLTDNVDKKVEHRIVFFFDN